MANTNEKKFSEALTIRVSPEFFAQLDEMGALIGGYPSRTRSELIREAVEEKLERVRAAKPKRKAKA